MINYVGALALSAVSMDLPSLFVKHQDRLACLLHIQKMAQNGVKHFIFEIIAVASAGCVNDVANICHKIHSLLGDSYGCVNHACGAIDPLSRVEYKSYPSCLSRSLAFIRGVLM